MLASLVLFTINSLLIKYMGSNAGISPWIALAVRSAMGLAVLALFFNRTGQVHFRNAATRRWLVYRGVFGLIGTVAYYFTIPTLGAGKATLISSTYVVIAALLAVWVVGEKLRLVTLAGILLAGVGLYFLLGLSYDQIATVSWYELLSVLGAIFAAASVVVIRRLTRTENSPTIFASQCIFVFGASLPFAIWSYDGLSPLDIMVLLAAGCFATFGQLAMTEGFRHLTVATGGAFQMTVPVLISIGSIFFFGEVFQPIQLFGAALILIGCYGAIALRP